MQETPDTGIEGTKFTGTYTDYLRSRDDDAINRWEHQCRQEQDELTWCYGKPCRTSKRWDITVRVVSHRVNDAGNRLRLLEKQQVPKLPQGIKFSGITACHYAEDSERDSAVVVAKDLALEKNS